MEKEMKEKLFFTIAGIIFGIVGIIHLIRAVLEWEIFIEQFTLPVWFSYIIGLFALFLSYIAYKLRSSKTSLSKR